MLRYTRLLLNAKLSTKIKPIQLENGVIEEALKCKDGQIGAYLDHIEETNNNNLYCALPAIYAGSNDLKINGKILLKLSKIRLTSFVVMTQLTGYLIACDAIDPLIILCSSLGTGLTSASAATINQILEIPFDSQMSRTKDRVLVRSSLSPESALAFALISALGGLFVLSYFVSYTTALLALGNIVLYSFIYTPMKRYSVGNTWLGAFVGAVPPIIGWHAATGQFDLGCLALSGILYCWQIPHFNSLSWNYREEYSLAGYRLTSFLYPNSCIGASLRHSFYLSLICLGGPLIGCGNAYFSLLSCPLNMYLIYSCIQFYKNPNRGTSRKLFFFSLAHLPLLLLILIATKYAETALQAN